MMRPILLDLYCSAGGATRGYQMAGFQVIGVDIEEQPHYCGDSFVRMDALAALDTLIDGKRLRFAGVGMVGLSELDAIHASPPCQKYTGMRAITLSRFGHVNTDPPDLIAPTRQRLERTGKPWVIENVKNSPLHTQVILCGAAFGLRHVARHRHFESNVLLMAPPKCAHLAEDYIIGIYGAKPDGRRVSYKHHRLCRIARSVEEARQLMGIDWMDWNEIKEAIPPVYTEWIGQRIMEQKEKSA